MKKFLAGIIILLSFSFFTTNASAQWKQIFLPLGDSAYGVNALASSGGYIYAGGYVNSNPILFRSSDDGVTWTSIVGNTFSRIYSLAADKKNVYVGFSDYVESSSNAGANWNEIFPPKQNFELGGLIVYSIAVSGSDLFLGTVGGPPGAGMYASNNNGSTWNTTGPLGYGDTSGLSLASDNIFALYGDNSALYAGTDQGVYVAGFPEQGGGWIPVNTGIESRNVNAIAEIGSKLFVGTDSGIFSSVNSGSSWKSASPFPSPFYSLATNGKDFFAAIGNENGVDYSPDTGQDWYAANDGLSVYAIINAFSLTISGAYVYLAADSSLWQRPLSDLDGVSQQPIPNQSELFQNYPNPFNTSTAIHYTLSKSDHVSIAVYNMLGERVAILKDDIEPAGDNEATFVSGRLPSGLYCYRLSTASGGTITRIMQIEK